jgi:flagellar hook-length control protein FliK
VAAVLSPLQNNADGVYRLRMQLHPVELGRVDIDVEIRGGVVHATLHAEQANATHMLRDSLPELRGRLEQEGVRTGNVTVNGREPGTANRDRGTNGTNQTRGGNNRGNTGGDGDDDSSQQRSGRQMQNQSDSVLDLMM